MRETGSLLRDTLEREAGRRTLIADAESNAKNIIAKAETDAEELLKNTHNLCNQHRIEYHRNMDAELITRKNEYVLKSEEAIRNMNRKFSEVRPAFSKEIAERIIQHGS